MSFTKIGGAATIAMFPSGISNRISLMSGAMHRRESLQGGRTGMARLSMTSISFLFFPTLFVVTEPMNIVPAGIVYVLIEEQVNKEHTSRGVESYL